MIGNKTSSQGRMINCLINFSRPEKIAADVISAKIQSFFASFFCQSNMLSSLTLIPWPFVFFITSADWYFLGGFNMAIPLASVGFACSGDQLLSEKISIIGGIDSVWIAWCFGIFISGLIFFLSS